MTFIKGQKAWNKGIKTGIIPKSAFKKGHISPMKGKHHSNISNEKNRLAHLGKIGFWTGEKLLIKKFKKEFLNAT